MNKHLKYFLVGLPFALIISAITFPFTMAMGLDWIFASGNIVSILLLPFQVFALIIYSSFISNILLKIVLLLFWLAICYVIGYAIYYVKEAKKK